MPSARVARLREAFEKQLSNYEHLLTGELTEPLLRRAFPRSSVRYASGTAAVCREGGGGGGGMLRLALDRAFTSLASDAPDVLDAL